VPEVSRYSLDYSSFSFAWLTGVSPKSSDEQKFDHPTQKPVELMRRPILNHLKRGELVYDAFLGSGAWQRPEFDAAFRKARRTAYAKPQRATSTGPAWPRRLRGAV
jgi:hypothetical protein